MSDLTKLVNSLPVTSEEKVAVLIAAESEKQEQELLFFDELLEEAIGFDLPETYEILFPVILDGHQVSLRTKRYKKAAIRKHLVIKAELEQPGHKNSGGSNKPARYPRKWAVRVIEAYINEKL